jgi:hypothetical protein
MARVYDTIGSSYATTRRPDPRIAGAFMLAALERAAGEERGDSLVNLVVLAVGLSAAAAAVVVLLRPAIVDAGQRMVNFISDA